MCCGDEMYDVWLVKLAFDQNIREMATDEPQCGKTGVAPHTTNVCVLSVADPEACDSNFLPPDGHE
jgi:hypothetical protein